MRKAIPEEDEFSKRITELQHRIATFSEGIGAKQNLAQETESFCEEIEDLLDALRLTYEEEVDQSSKRIAGEEIAEFKEHFFRFLRDEVLSREPDATLRDKIKFIVDRAIMNPKVSVENFVSDMRNYVYIPRDSQTRP